jgi:hypothetical protein
MLRLVHNELANTVSVRLFLSLVTEILSSVRGVVLNVLLVVGSATSVNLDIRVEQ